MTTDIITTEWFDAQKERRPIRFIQESDKTFIPVQDIAQATGLRKRSLLNVLDKNVNDFREHERDVRLSTPGGYQQVRCIDRDGRRQVYEPFKNVVQRLLDAYVPPGKD